MTSAQQNSARPLTKARPHAAMETLEGRALMSTAPLVHLAGQYAGAIHFPTPPDDAITLTITSQKGHAVTAVIQQGNGSRLQVRGYLDSHRDLYFVFNATNFTGHGFGQAHIGTNGQVTGSSTTYTPFGHLGATFSVKAIK
jgi:hypothetical protein